MGKPKKYIGETWSNPFDHGGKDYRWDHKKKEYVVSHGESPISSITRALKEKFPDPLEHLDDARTEWEAEKKKEAEKQPPEEKPKKKKPSPLEHLDDARDERDNKWAEGLEGIGDSLSQDDEAESTLESIATIVDAAATIKKAHDNRKKSGEPTETKSGDNIAEKDHEFYSKITGDFYNFDETDAGLKRNYYLEQLDTEDPKQRVMQHNGAVNLTNADIGQEKSHYQIMLKKEAAKAEARNQWLQKTSNSPAAKAFEPDDPRRESWDNMRYEQHLKHTGVDSVDTPEAKIEENKLEKENKAADLPDKTIADDTTSIFENNKDKFKIGGRSLFGNMA